MNASDIPQPVGLFDLGAASRRVGFKRKYRRVTEAVRRYRDALSAKTDLRGAMRKLELLVSIAARIVPVEHVEVQDRDQGLIAGSLFQAALLMYARIVTENDDRSRVPLERGGSADVVAAHGRVLSLRHQAIGHFGYNKDHVDGAWADDRVYLRIEEGGVSLVEEYLRTNYTQNMVADLLLCIEHGLRTIDVLINERQLDVFSSFNHLDDLGWQAIYAEPAQLVVQQHRADLGVPPTDQPLTTLSPPRDRSATS